MGLALGTCRARKHQGPWACLGQNPCHPREARGTGVKGPDVEDT